MTIVYSIKKKWIINAFMLNLITFYILINDQLCSQTSESSSTIENFLFSHSFQTLKPENHVTRSKRHRKIPTKDAIPAKILYAQYAYFLPWYKTVWNTKCSFGDGSVQKMTAAQNKRAAPMRPLRKL